MLGLDATTPGYPILAMIYGNRHHLPKEIQAPKKHHPLHFSVGSTIPSVKLYTQECVGSTIPSVKPCTQEFLSECSLRKQVPFSALRFILYWVIHTYVWGGYVHMCVSASGEQRHKLPLGARVIGNCQLPDVGVGAEHWTGVLWTSNVCS